MNQAGQCTAKVPQDGSHRIILRLVDRSGTGIPFRRVNFQIRGPAGSVTPFNQTGETGLVEAIWTGVPAGETVVIASANVDGRRVVREIKVEAAATPPKNLTLAAVSGLRQFWYESRQLPRPITIAVDGADASCTGAVVSFRASSGGAVSPDSVYAARGTDPNTLQSRCLAQAYWKLGEGVGTQHLIATVRGQPAQNITVSARARKLPRIGGGLAATHVRTHHVPKVDTATNDTTVERIDANVLFRPVISVDFPAFRRIAGFRGSVAVSASSPDRDWYLGFSAIQPFYGISHEALGVDMHVITHFGRRRVLDNVRNCESGVSCDSDDKVLLLGGGVMFIVDGTSVLTAISGALK